MDTIARYQDAVNRLYATIQQDTRLYMESHNNQDFFLERMQRLCAALGNPERDFDYVHVAGSVGKGSTSMGIYEILRASGRRVGIYLSPHVTTALERIQANGQLVSLDDFVAAVDTVLPVAEHIAASDSDWAPSYSEIFFAVGLVALQRAGVDWVVVETGCGGRFDMSNVIPAPRACVLTPIDYDHTDVLGDTLEQIAWHKAGIIKSGSLVFSSETNPDVRAVFDQSAATAGLMIDYSASNVSDQFSIPLVGEHQQRNARLAAVVGRALGVDNTTIQTGLQQVRLPARLEIIQDQPRVIIDGGHAPKKIQALVNALPQLVSGDGKIQLLVGFKEGKAVDTLVSLLAPIADSVICTGFQLPGFGAHDVADVARLFTAARPELSVRIEPDPTAAVQKAMADLQSEDTLIITGSLYLAGIAREQWISEEHIITTRQLF